MQKQEASEARWVGRYRLERHVARGGMGDVWMAWHTGPGGFQRRVALKRMLPQARVLHHAVEQFQREARLGACLVHPNVVPVLDAGEHEGVPYLVMDWVDGMDLRRLLHRMHTHGGRMPPALAAHVVHQVLCALEAAAGLTDASGTPTPVVHRDISPDNVMVGHWGEVKLTDFGLAREMWGASFTEAGTIKGKLAYMAAEQLAGLALDERADLYAVGIMFHEMLCGARPYEVDNPLLAMELARHPNHHPLHVLPGLPPVLAELSWRWRQAFPDERGPSIQAARVELERALYGVLSGPPASQLAEWMRVVTGTGGGATSTTVVLSAASVRGCAKCGGTLAGELLRGGVLVDRCPDCHGLFLERGEQVRILGGEARLDLTLDLPAESQEGALDAVRGECPRCRIRMQLHRARGMPFHIERCGSCAGVWLDAGELERLVAGDVAQAVHVLGAWAP